MLKPKRKPPPSTPVLHHDGPNPRFADPVQIRVAIPRELHDRLREWAFKDRRSIASVVRLAIEASL
jgi:hypothetical protein